MTSLNRAKSSQLLWCSAQWGPVIPKTYARNGTSGYNCLFSLSQSIPENYSNVFIAKKWIFLRLSALLRQQPSTSVNHGKWEQRQKSACYSVCTSVTQSEKWNVSLSARKTIVWLDVMQGGACLSQLRHIRHNCFSWFRAVISSYNRLTMYCTKSSC